MKNLKVPQYFCKYLRSGCSQNPGDGSIKFKIQFCTRIKAENRESSETKPQYANEIFAFTLGSATSELPKF